MADALATGDLAEARRTLAYIVGRDTAELDENGIWRALVETVAENTSDGIIAPLFWLTLTGPVGAMVYKAVSTLDSMVGYRNERYLQFGWASARMDDLLNFIPARLTALLMILAAPLAGLSMKGSLAVTLRDRLKHPSPNSGHPEAAAAGALGVQLGGPAQYKGTPSWKEYIGTPLSPLDERAYRDMLKLMYLTTLLMAAACHRRLCSPWEVPMSHTYDHGGNVFDIARQLGAEPADIIDFSASINPLGLSSMVRKSIICALDSLVHYPDNNHSELKQALAAYHGLSGRKHRHRQRLHRAHLSPACHAPRHTGPDHLTLLQRVCALSWPATLGGPPFHPQARKQFFHRPGGTGTGPGRGV